ncbi:hypothetical protein MTBPR1_120043 [Candidatus Terasakiella magnetica]|uniref:Uncharacterized protein n=1 Tax=Candidatus Terasakiella magnetica TaxID=1867952 RepID=A0A1C3REM8_9PROT|nr:hypothetical protein MTBPR1_120043 [Candidatus Terasakiella magnetica]
MGTIFFIVGKRLEEYIKRTELTPYLKGNCCDLENRAYGPSGLKNNRSPG